MRGVFNRLQRNYRLRILYAKVIPFFKKTGLLNAIKKLEIEGSNDPWFSEKKKNIEDEAKSFNKYSLDLNGFINSGAKYKIGFLIDDNNIPQRYRDNIYKACKFLNVTYKIFNIYNTFLFEQLRNPDCDGILIWPNYNTNLIRNLFHESTHILNSEGKVPIYPSLRELNIYEAKRSLINFLIINNIPHPRTQIFYDYKSSIDFIENAEYPLVFKTHIGASASGVEILWSQKEAAKLVKRLFNKYYLRKGEHDNRSMEWGYIILQEYLENVKEFRIIKIGDSWWGHQKWKRDDQIFMSGSGEWKKTPPSERLLNFCYNIAQRYSFNSMCFDIFEDKDSNLLVNELQTWFGSYNPSQMYINGVPGRYRKVENHWIFEPGLFNIYGSMVIRIADFIKMLSINIS